MAPLSFSVDFILKVVRYTVIEGKQYLGVSLDAYRFIGFELEKNKFGIINKDLPTIYAASLLKFPYEDVWNILVLSLIVYPFVHIVIGCIYWLIVDKLPKKF